MKQEWFKIELLSDIIVSADSATDSEHESLDFLPGSIFWGAVIANFGGTFAPENFLSGKIRFNNAYPLADDHSPVYPMPLAFHQYKGESGKVLNCALLHPEKQTEQLRKDYISQSLKKYSVPRNYRMKTSIDRESGCRARDNMLFGYNSIAAGTVFALRVDFDDSIGENTQKKVAEILLSGRVRVGKSRSAEYGEVKISKLAATAKLSTGKTDGSLLLYLYSDLALTANGAPVLAPTAKDLGLPANLSVDLQKSFVRTRKYSPWNSFFSCRMRERQVICRGSVLVLKGQHNPAEIAGLLAAGVGMHREEGLGQILVNPAFLTGESFDLATGSAAGASAPEHFTSPSAAAATAAVKKLLENKARTRTNRSEALKIGREWAKKWFDILKKLKRLEGDAPGKSQWASVRELAMRFAADKNDQSLMKNLEEFCTKDNRARTWSQLSIREGNQRVCMYEQLKSDFSGESRKNYQLAAQALFHAAVEVSRCLNRQEQRG